MKTIPVTRPIRPVLLASCCACLLSCAVGPNFKQPGPPPVSGYTLEPLNAGTTSGGLPAGASPRFVVGMDIPGEWWALFHSPPLNHLVEEALHNNPTIDAAQKALVVARENVAAQKGSYYPSVTANFTPSYNKTATGSLSPASASGNPYYTLYTAQLTVNFVPDVFGVNRRTVESLQAQADSQRFQVEATYLTLSSNVVTAAIQEALLRGQIQANQEIVKEETEALTILKRQLELGQVAGADVAAQEALLAQAQAALPPLQKQLDQQRDLLNALVGHFPSEDIGATFNLEGFELPRSLPVTIPARLLEQRPDVRMAVEQLHSASAEVGVAIGNLLPSISLSANGGKAVNYFSQFFGPGTLYWTLAASITQPIFEGGTLIHRERAARAAYEQSLALYRSAVVTALQNVADALRALQSDSTAVAVAANAERTANTSLEITRKQLALGQVAYLNLLTAQQAYQSALNNLIQARATRLSDTAALFQALGGGWWNRVDVAGTRVAQDGTR